MPDSPFEIALDLRVAEVLERCTSCGACVEVCPMPEAAGIDASDPQAIAGGVLAILRGTDYPDAAARWATVCSGSGHCIPACQHGVNPRFMLAMARLALQRRTDAAARRRDAFARFGGMTKGVRVLSRMQLAPDLLSRFRADDTDDDRPPDVVFYTGCNLIKTPHIALLCFDIMEALGVRYRVMGGPSHCCGVLQFRAGDVATSGRVAYRTLERLAGAVGGRALTWCPTCQVQLGEIVAPGKTDTALDLQPFLLFLAARLDELRPLMTHRVEKRVGLHEHPGIAGVSEAARAILEAIPGLEFVDLAQPRVGYMCNTLNPLPDFKRDIHRTQLQIAADAGVTTLAGIYHNCHRELCSHERDWPFEVVNFLELVGESMGLTRPDLFKRLKLMQDVDAVLADAAPLLATNQVDLNEARAVVLTDMLGEQALPLR
ncbi:MAG TPA: (Fe-S)-binding protein [Acetobacteraceae bacterium]|jgi:Fe-S oxidoreductase|nr:(Fe-S)-binding protein [Acetobacteraceae bacterium]